MSERDLKLKRPLAVIDLETTGLNVDTSRIVEIAVIKIMPDGERLERVRRINPGIPIPPEATAIHGISDEDVADKPVFERVAKGLLNLIDDSDLAGYNILHYDLPLLQNELSRAGFTLEMEDRSVIDVFKLFGKMEPRTLGNAYKYYCGKNLDDAHSAAADAGATFEILQAQIARYDSLPNDVKELGHFSAKGEASYVDSEGKLIWKDDEAVFNFGKHNGRGLKEVAESDPDYLDWIKRADFRKDLRLIVHDALKGDFPVRENKQ